MSDPWSEAETSFLTVYRAALTMMAEQPQRSMFPPGDDPPLAQIPFERRALAYVGAASPEQVAAWLEVSLAQFERTFDVLQFLYAGELHAHGIKYDRVAQVMRLPTERNRSQ
jgi:hypothetical protein